MATAESASAARSREIFVSRHAASLATLALPLARALQVMRQRRDPQVLGIALGSALAVFSIGVHGLADFNLQIPANAATIVALLALMLGLPSESRRQRRRAGESAEQPPD